MVGIAKTTCLMLCLGTLAACGGTSRDDAEQLDASLLGKGRNSDPALTAALEDQIMVDPALAGPANANAIRPGDDPMQAPIPPEKDGNAPVTGDGRTLGQLAAQQVSVNKGGFNGCGLDVDDRLAFVGIGDARVGLAEEAVETLVIGVAMAHRLLEDRWVGGDAGQTVLLNQLAQPAFVQNFAVYEV